MEGFLGELMDEEGYRRGGWIGEERVSVGV